MNGSQEKASYEFHVLNGTFGTWTNSIVDVRGGYGFYSCSKLVCRWSTSGFRLHLPCLRQMHEWRASSGLPASVDVKTMDTISLRSQNVSGTRLSRRLQRETEREREHACCVAKSNTPKRESSSVSARILPHNNNNNNKMVCHTSSTHASLPQAAIHAAKKWPAKLCRIGESCASVGIQRSSNAHYPWSPRWRWPCIFNIASLECQLKSSRGWTVETASFSSCAQCVARD